MTTSDIRAQEEKLKRFLSSLRYDKGCVDATIRLLCPPRYDKSQSPWPRYPSIATSPHLSLRLFSQRLRGMKIEKESFFTHLPSFCFKLTVWERKLKNYGDERKTHSIRTMHTHIRTNVSLLKRGRIFYSTVVGLHTNGHCFRSWTTKGIAGLNWN
jgi:hypothetical protein